MGKKTARILIKAITFFHCISTLNRSGFFFLVVAVFVVVAMAFSLLYSLLAISHLRTRDEKKREINGENFESRLFSLIPLHINISDWVMLALPAYVSFSLSIFLFFYHFVDRVSLFLLPLFQYLRPCLFIHFFL